MKNTTTNDLDFIPIVFSSDNNYAPYLSVIMLSIIKNCDTQKKYEFIVLETSIEAAEKDILLTMIREYNNFTLRFIRVSDYVDSKEFYTDTYFSIETYYRLYIPTLLKEYKKVIYLDVDMIVLDDISKLFEIELNGKTIGATINLSTIGLYNSDKITWKETNWKDYFDNVIKIKDPKRYFQAGVMVIDVEKMIANNDQEHLVEKALSFSHLLVDQDVLNSYYNGDVTLIDQVWDFEWHFSFMDFQKIRDSLNDNALFAKLLQAMASFKIIHYDGILKPWKNTEYSLADIWWDYAKTSPFYDEILKKLEDYNANLQKIDIDKALTKSRLSLVWGYQYNKWLSKIAKGNKRKKYLEKKYSYKNTLREVRTIRRNKGYRGNFIFSKFKSPELTDYRFFGISVYKVERRDHTIRKKILGIRCYKKFNEKAYYSDLLNTNILHLENELGEQNKYLESKPDEQNKQLSLIVAQEVSRALSVYNLHQQVFPKYKNIHQGKEVVLVATGPSLNDYIPIEGAVHVGVNKAFEYNQVAFDFLFLQDYSGQTPTYIDEFVNNKSKGKFIGILDSDFYAQSVIPENYSAFQNVNRYYIDSVNKKKNFTYDIASQPLGDAKSIAFAAMQFILWTQPRKIYLVGCDCSHSGYYTNTETNYLEVDIVLDGWKRLKKFIEIYYPEIEIVSVNPVGLKGLFNDIITKK